MGITSSLLDFWERHHFLTVLGFAGLYFQHPPPARDPKAMLWIRNYWNFANISLPPIFKIWSWINPFTDPTEKSWWLRISILLLNISPALTASDKLTGILLRKRQLLDNKKLLISVKDGFQSVHVESFQVITSRAWNRKWKFLEEPPMPGWTSLRTGGCKGND